MDARELTQVTNKHANEIYELKKQVDFLRQEFEKQRLIISDMQIDIKMLDKNSYATACREAAERM